MSASKQTPVRQSPSKRSPARKLDYDTHEERDVPQSSSTTNTTTSELPNLRNCSDFSVIPEPHKAILSWILEYITYH